MAAGLDSVIKLARNVYCTWRATELVDSEKWVGGKFKKRKSPRNAGPIKCKDLFSQLFTIHSPLSTIHYLEHLSINLCSPCAS